MNDTFDTLSTVLLLTVRENNHVLQGQRQGKSIACLCVHSVKLAGENVADLISTRTRQLASHRKMKDYLRCCPTTIAELDYERRRRLIVIMANNKTIYRD